MGKKKELPLSPRGKLPPLPVSLPRAPIGRPRIEDDRPKDATKIRAMLLRGESAAAIMAEVGCGTTVIVRLRREIEAEQNAERRGLLVQVVEAAVAGGMSREQAVNLIHQATGIALEVKGKEAKP